MRRRRKRFAWPVLLVFGLPALLAVAWLAAWLVLSPIVERRIEALLEERFAGDVELASVHYLAPFWVVASDGVLRSEVAGEPVEWIRVGSLRARLDRVPGTGPIRIERLALDDVTATLLRDGGELRDASDLWRGGKRRSRRLPLRSIDVGGLTVAYRSAPDAEPLLFAGFDLSLAVAPDERSRAYDVRVTGGDERLELDAKARLELDAQALQIESLDAVTTLPPGARGGIPVRLAGAKGTIERQTACLELYDGRLSIGRDAPLELGGLRLTASAARGTTSVRDIRAALLGGTLEGSADVRGGDDGRWDARLSTQDLDLAQLARRFTRSDVRGRLSLAGRFSGPLGGAQGALLDGLEGDGALNVTRGRLYEVPVVAELLEAVKVGAEAATVSTATSAFSIRDREVKLSDLSLGSPAVGMHGHGEVGFDGRVELDVVVAPLGDWKEKLEGTGVPIVGGALAAIAGAVQSLFTEASSIVYEFRVTGTLGDPTVVPVLAPVLTEATARLFSSMITGSWQEDVVSGRSLRRRGDAGSPRASRE